MPSNEQERANVKSIDYLNKSLQSFISKVIDNFALNTNDYKDIATEIKRLIDNDFKGNIQQHEKELLESVEEEYNSLTVDFEFDGETFEYEDVISKEGFQPLSIEDEVFQNYCLENNISEDAQEDLFKRFNYAYNEAAIKVFAENVGHIELWEASDYQYYWMERILEDFDHDKFKNINTKYLLGALLNICNNFILGEYADSESPITDYLNDVLEFLNSDHLKNIKDQKELFTTNILSTLTQAIQACERVQQLNSSSSDLEAHRIYAAVFLAIEQYLGKCLYLYVSTGGDVSTGEITIGTRDDSYVSSLDKALDSAQHFHKTYVIGHEVSKLTSLFQSSAADDHLDLASILSSLMQRGRSIAAEYYYIKKIAPVEAKLDRLQTSKTKSEEKILQAANLLSEENQNYQDIKNGKIKRNMPNIFVPNFIFGVKITEATEKRMQFISIPFNFNNEVLLYHSDSEKNENHNDGVDVRKHAEGIVQRFMRLNNEDGEYKKLQDLFKHRTDSEMLFTRELDKEENIKIIADVLLSKLPKQVNVSFEIESFTILAYSSLATCDHCTRAIIVTINNREEDGFLSKLATKFFEQQITMKTNEISTRAIVVCDGHYHKQESLVSAYPEIIISDNGSTIGINNLVELVAPQLPELDEIGHSITATASGVFNLDLQNFNILKTRLIRENIGAYGVLADDASGSQLILTHQESCSVSESLVRYYGAGVNELLHLRIKDAGLSDIAILKTSFLSEATVPYLLDTALTKIQAGFNKVILPLNIDGKHWVGLVIENQDNHLDIKYLDSENREMPINAQEALSVTCAQRGYQVTFSIVMGEEQKYSNCGPELIENFVMLLTGNRATQEAAVPLHSLLYANSVLDSESSALQIAENSRMIEQLSNKNTPLHRMSTASYVSQSQDQDMVLVVQNLELPKVYNVQQQLTDMDRVLHLFQKHGIQMTLDEAMTDRGYRKASLKLHPDKGGNKEDFQFFKEFRDNFNNHDTAEQTIYSTEITIQKACYYSSMTFKTLDIGVNTVRAYNNPTTHNIADATIGGSHLLSMVTGVTKFSTAASVFSVGYTCYENGIYEGAKSALITSIYIAAPYSITAAGSQYLAAAYTVGLTVYSAYSLVNNAWSLYDELYPQNSASDLTEVQNAGIVDAQIDEV